MDMDLGAAIADFFARTTFAVNGTDIDDPFLNAVSTALTDTGWQSTALITTDGDGQRVTADFTHPDAEAIVMATCAPDAPALIQILQPLDWAVTCTEGDAATVAAAINAVTAQAATLPPLTELMGAHGFTAEHTPATPDTAAVWAWQHGDGRRACWYAPEAGQQHSGSWEFAGGAYRADGNTPVPVLADLLALPAQP
jgi:hypothetical protein